MPTESNHYFPRCQLQIEDAFIKKSATSISAFLLGSHKKNLSTHIRKDSKRYFKYPQRLTLKRRYCRESIVQNHRRDINKDMVFRRPIKRFEKRRNSKILSNLRKKKKIEEKIREILDPKREFCHLYRKMSSFIGPKRPHNNRRIIKHPALLRNILNRKQIKNI